MHAVSTWMILDGDPSVEDQPGIGATAGLWGDGLVDQRQPMVRTFWFSICREAQLQPLPAHVPRKQHAAVSERCRNGQAVGGTRG